MVFLYIILAFLVGGVIGMDIESKRSVNERIYMFNTITRLSSENDQLRLENEALKNGYVSKEENQCN